MTHSKQQKDEFMKELHKNALGLAQAFKSTDPAPIEQPDKEYPEDWDIFMIISFLITEEVDSYASPDHESYYPGIEKDLMPKIVSLIESHTNAARIDELKHIEGEDAHYWWGEKTSKRDIAMTVIERIAELEKEITT